MRVRIRIAILILAAICPILAAQRVDPTNTHFRVWAFDSVVTTVDAKTKVKTSAPAHVSGMLAYTVIYHPKDPTICLVEYL